MKSITLTLPTPISANAYWKSFVIGKRVMVAPSHEAKKYKKMVAMVAMAAGIKSPIKGRVHVHIDLYPRRPQDWEKRAQKNPTNWDDTVQSIDIDNARKCLYDAMKNLVFEDDKFVWSDSAKRCEPDGDARVVVTITPIETEVMQGSLI
jgi:crossover junction endodeoxyribonuclease RusA